MCKQQLISLFKKSHVPEDERRSHDATIGNMLNNMTARLGIR